MSPRIKLAVAAHIDDSSIFFPLFFHCLLSVLASWLRPPPPTPFLSLRSSHLPYSSSFCLLPLTLYAFFVSPLFSLFFPPFWLPASSPFFSPVFLSSRLFALSVFYPFSSFPLSSVSPPSCDSFYMRIIIQGRPGYSVTDDFTRSRALVMHPY